MVMIDWYKDALTKYIIIDGRSSRAAFWYFILANLLISLILLFADSILQNILGTNQLLRAVYTIFIFVPTVTLSVRRFHDIGKSGWWYLINLIPVLGFIIYLYFMCQPSQPSVNAYGPKPVA